MANKEEDVKQPIIIKKVNISGGGHHGGAWKVAYADFVTAMMAFFLLMWLLNATTEEQRTGIADYFNPSTDPMSPRVSVSLSGAESILAGTTVAPDGAMTSTTQPLVNTPDLTNVNIDANTDSAAQEAEQEAFDAVAEEIKQAIQEDPAMADLTNNLLIDETPEGLRIQIVDQEGKSMFPSGSARMFAKMQELLAKLAPIIKDAPNQLSIRGHTDSIPYRGRDGYSNWELSADRANSTRKVLLEAGYPKEKLDDVVGKADTDPKEPENPSAASNRRISLILIKEAITKAKKDAESGKGTADYLRAYKTPQRQNTIIEFK